MKTSALPMAAMVLALASCGQGDWAAYEPDVDGLPPDEMESSYPVGPYGSAVGQILGDITFNTAFFDPYTTCKAPTDWVLRSAGPRQLSLSELRRGHPLCPNHGKKRLLLVTTAPT